MFIHSKLKQTLGRKDEIDCPSELTEKKLCFSSCIENSKLSDNAILHYVVFNLASLMLQ